MHRISSLAFVRIFVVSVCTTACCCAQAQAAEWQPLWPGTPPGVTVPSPAEGDTPELFLTRVESGAPTAGVVILPGGGYHGLAMSHEGYEFAEAFKSLGITSVICKYRVRGKGNDTKGYGHPYPMMDAQRALQTMRANAEQWNIDPDRIGVIGFSAGGHLTSTVSTKFVDADPSATDPVLKVSSRPNFSILCYPVIGFSKPYSHGGSEKNLLGSDPDPKLVASLSNEDQVSDQTPPTFLFHTAEDPVVDVENSIQYFRSCQKHGVEAELHVFPKGRHGLGLAKEIEGAQQWPALCKDWLRRLGMTAE